MRKKINNTHQFERFVLTSNVLDAPLCALTPASHGAYRRGANIHLHNHTMPL